MRRRRERQNAGEARIVDDLDLAAERPEAGALVERERRRMIEGAGVHPDPRHWLRPGARQRLGHQPAPGAAADQRRGNAEERQFAIAGRPEVELEQPRIHAAALQRIDLDLRRLQDRRELGVRHDQARVPQPILADAAIERAKPRDVRRDHPPQRPPAIRHAARRRRHEHLQMRDHGRDLAGRQVVMVIGQRGGHPGSSSPGSLASRPFTARLQPLSLRCRVASLMFGLKRCSSRQLSAKRAGSG